MANPQPNQSTITGHQWQSETSSRFDDLKSSIGAQLTPQQQTLLNQTVDTIKHNSLDRVRALRDSYADVEGRAQRYAPHDKSVLSQAISDISTEFKGGQAGYKSQQHHVLANLNFLNQTQIDDIKKAIDKTTDQENDYQNTVKQNSDKLYDHMRRQIMLKVMEKSWEWMPSQFNTSQPLIDAIYNRSQAQTAAGQIAVAVGRAAVNDFQEPEPGDYHKPYSLVSSFLGGLLGIRAVGPVPVSVTKNSDGSCSVEFSHGLLMKSPLIHLYSKVKTPEAIKYVQRAIRQAIMTVIKDGYTVDLKDLPPEFQQDGYVIARSLGLAHNEVDIGIAVSPDMIRKGNDAQIQFNKSIHANVAQLQIPPRTPSPVNQLPPPPAQPQLQVGNNNNNFPPPPNNLRIMQPVVQQQQNVNNNNLNMNLMV